MTDSAKLLMLVTVEWMDGQTQELPSTFHPIRMCVYDVKKIDDGITQQDLCRVIYLSCKTLDAFEC